MRLAVIVNRVAELRSSMTTVMILTRAAARGHEVLVCDVGDFGLAVDDRVMLAGKWLRGTSPDDDQAMTQLKLRPTETVSVDALDAVLIRTNPARDRDRLWAHDSALIFARLAHDRGALVLNDPRGLVLAANKSFLTRLPAECRPTSFVSRDADAISAFVSQLDSPCILKPLHGTHGRDVFRVEPGERSNLRQIIDVLIRADYALVQEYLHEAARGDTRVLLLDGEPIQIDGHAVAFTRVARGEDFRCNVAQGAKTEPAQIDAAMRRTIELMAPELRSLGLWLVGLDFIGSRVVEVNVFSPGGFRAAERFYAKDFTGAFLEALETRCASRAAMPRAS
jgi:glutathione synthase